MPRRRRASRPITRAEDEGMEGESPLFEDVSELAYISVSRDEPEEGYVGRISPAATEKDILKKFGGGTYTLSPKGNGGKYVKGLGQRILVIAGDPIFQSRAAELKWKRQQGLAEEPGAAAKPAAIDKPMSFVEMMLLIDKQSERSRQIFQEHADQRQREAEAAHQRQLELVREDSKRREKELEAERTRLAQEAADREARAAREQAAEQERQRQHMALMLQLVKEKSTAAADSTPMSSLMAGVKLALDLKGDGDGARDPLSALAENLPEVIAQARQLVSAEKQQTAGNPADDDDQSVKLEGHVGQKARRLIEYLQAAGKDPAAELERTFDLLTRHQAAKQAAPAAPSSSVPARRPRPAPAPAPARARAAARRPTPAATKSRGARKSASR
jgi:hypothetical protein